MRDGNCGTNDGSTDRGTDHGPDLDAVENAGTTIVGTDVDPRGIADDGIHCDGGLGADCYASCHRTYGVNCHVVPSHLRYRIMPSKQSQVWLDKRCETYH